MEVKPRRAWRSCRPHLIWWKVLGGIVAAGLLSAAGCDGDGPVMPEEPKDYVVYYRDAEGGGYNYRYHLATGRLDSLVMPVAVTSGQYLSADGSLMYVPHDAGIHVVAMDGLSVVDELPYPAARSIVCSPDGRYVAVHDSDLYILDASDYRVVGGDTAFTSGGSFSPDGDRFYYCTPDSLEVMVMSVGSGTVDTLDREEILAPPVIVRPTPDETKWLIYQQLGSFTARFIVYEPSLDSVVYLQDIWPGFGDLEMTPDGRYAFISVPGDPSNNEIGWDHFYVFDIYANRMKTIVNTVGISDGINPEHMSIGKFVVSPDSRWLLATAGDYQHHFLVFDIADMEIERYVETGDVRPVDFAGRLQP